MTRMAHVQNKRPGIWSHLIVLRLLMEAVLEIIILPARLLAFLSKRKRINHEMDMLIKNQSDSKKNTERLD